MKTAVFFTFCLFLTAADTFADTIERKFEVSKGGQLDVKLVSGGSIAIHGWDKETVEVKLSFKRSDSDDWTIEIEQGRSGVEVYTKAPKWLQETNSSLRVMVPSEFDLYLKTAGGSVVLEGIEGDIRGSTAGGQLDLSDLKGTVDLSTGGGPVTISDSELDGEVTTGGGRVLVENVVGDIDARSGGGEVIYRNVKTPDKDYPAEMVHIRNAGGAIRVDEAPAGADVQTGGGDIRFRSVGEFVRAYTGGGNILLDEVDGWIKATTGAGDVEVSLIGDMESTDHDVEIRTGSGDVMVSLPRELSVEVDIQLAHTKGYRGRSRIISDIVLEEEESDSWEYGNGSPRKYIRGKASINGGRNLIKIRAVNGKVTLKYN